MLLRNACKGMSDYYVGARNIGGVAIGVSFFATFASTNSYIGHAGKGYAYGLPWLIMAVSLVVFTYLSWRWIAPSLRRYASRLDALTIPDYLTSRFVASGHSGAGLRFASALVVVFASLLYLVAIFKGAGHLFELFLGIPYRHAVGVTLVIVVLYTSLGGFVSVVRTDVVQGVLMLIGAMMLFYFITKAAGGVTAITQLPARPDTSFLFELNGGIALVVLLGISLSGSLKLMVDPRQLSRFYALKDDAQIRKGIWVAVIGLAVVQFCIFPIGVYAHLLMDGVQDTDLIVPMLVNNASVFPLWASDFLIVAIVAAAMSSMDSVLLVAASTLYKNMFGPLFAGRVSARREVMATRLAVVGFALIAAFLALDPPGDIVELTIFSGSLYAVCFFPAMVFGLHWRPGSSVAVLASMAAGTGTLIAWLWFDMRHLLHEVFPGLLASIVVYSILARLTPAAFTPNAWQQLRAPD